MNSKPIQIYSEIGPLKKVLLHRPNRELENLMPEYIDRLLFDDIPYLKIAQEEHDAFAELLRKNGVDVVYLTDLVAKSITNEEVKNCFIQEYVKEAGIQEQNKIDAMCDYFKSMPTNEMIDKMISGVRKTEIESYGSKSLIDYLDDDYPFIIDPVPNLYFTRDPFACVGNGATINTMSTVTRNRETLFAKYIFDYNPEYKGTPILYDRKADSSIEGGDILVLSPSVVAVGISQRTQPSSIETFAKRLFAENMGFKKVLAIDIPKTRSFMHLDTVFTMIDKDKFTIHPNIKNDMRVIVLENGGSETLKITEESDSLENILKKHLELDNVTLIKCGGGNVIDASREQWNDGSNTFAIAPGKVIAYSRNYVTNQIMQEAGIEVLTIPSSELSRGRGGPRCMTMPIIRESM